VISPEARPRLAAKARLKEDAKSGKLLLIYPEAGLQLNDTGAQVLRRCDGIRSVSTIVDELCAGYPGAPREQVAREVEELVARLRDRGLLVIEP
jgi:pyrroloquinoline quinone biosynthesis protein D